MDDDPTPTLDAPPVRLRAWRDDDTAVVVLATADPLIPLITTPPSGSCPSCCATWTRGA